MNLDAAARALYDACPTVKPTWDQLGEVTRSVWRDRVQQPQRKPMNLYETYRDMLPVSKHHIDDDLELQAEIQHRIAENLTTLVAAVAKAKEELKQTEAAVSVRVRRASGESRVTDKQIEAEVLRDPDRLDAYRKLMDVTEEHDRWDQLLKSWLARGYSLKGLGELHGQSYFAVDSVKRNVNVDELRAQARATAQRIDARRRQEGQPVVENTAPRPRRRAVE